LLAFLYLGPAVSSHGFQRCSGLGIERPHVRNIHSIRNLNTLTYILINARALDRIRTTKAQARVPT